VAENDEKFTVSLDREAGITEVAYHGVINLADRRRAVDRASRLMQERGCRAVLVDFRDAEMAMLDPQDESRFVDKLSSNEILAESRTAYLSRPNQSINWFIEVLARARHFPCRHFHTYEEARAWLLEQ